jgi:hypothetical protein
MLKTEQNTEAMAHRVHESASYNLGIDWDDLQVNFEHGQHWVTRLSTGAQWAADDAEGPETYGGFAFELVTPGDEE